jgi:hypothetical protein
VLRCLEDDLKVFVKLPKLQTEGSSCVQGRNNFSPEKILGKKFLFVSSSIETGSVDTKVARWFFFNQNPNLGKFWRALVD